MVTRTATLGRGTATAAGPTTVYTVPFGAVVIVKAVFIFDALGASAWATPLVRVTPDSGVTLALPIQGVRTGPAGYAYEYHGWFAIEAGDSLVIETDVDMAYRASGAILPAY